MKCGSCPSNSLWGVPRQVDEHPIRKNDGITRQLGVGDEHGHPSDPHRLHEHSALLPARLPCAARKAFWRPCRPRRPEIRSWATLQGKSQKKLSRFRETLRGDRNDNALPHDEAALTRRSRSLGGAKRGLADKSLLSFPLCREDGRRVVSLWNEPEYVGAQASYIFISLELSHSACLCDRGLRSEAGRSQFRYAPLARRQDVHASGCFQRYM